MQTASQDTSSDFTQRLCQASIVGDLDGVQALLTDWLRCASNHRSPPDPEPLQTALEAAAKHNQVSIVAYLVKQGLSCDRSTVKAALEGGATDVLQAFLDHGWDINGSLGLGSGPALTTMFVSLCYCIAIPSSSAMISWQSFLGIQADKMHVGYIAVYSRTSISSHGS